MKYLCGCIVEKVDGQIKQIIACDDHIKLLDIALSHMKKYLELWQFEEHPPDLGIHVTDGIKPEMKRGE